MGFEQVRIIFRFVELSGGVSSSNAILANEGYQLGLDALPMFIALLILALIHPGLVLKGPESSFQMGWRRGRGSKAANSSLLQTENFSRLELSNWEEARGSRIRVNLCHSLAGETAA